MNANDAAIPDIVDTSDAEQESAIRTLIARHRDVLSTMAAVVIFLEMLIYG